MFNFNIIINIIVIFIDIQSHTLRDTFVQPYKQAQQTWKIIF